MENINITATTIACPSTILSTPGSTSVSAMSPRGYALVARTDATDLLIDPSVSIRQGNGPAKGHVGFVARTRGIPAWSPPLC